MVRGQVAMEAKITNLSDDRPESGRMHITSDANFKLTH